MMKAPRAETRARTQKTMVIRTNYTHLHITVMNSSFIIHDVYNRSVLFTTTMVCKFVRTVVKEVEEEVGAQQERKRRKTRRTAELRNHKTRNI